MIKKLSSRHLYCFFIFFGFRLTIQDIRVARVHIDRRLVSLVNQEPRSAEHLIMTMIDLDFDPSLNSDINRPEKIGI